MFKYVCCKKLFLTLFQKTLFFETQIRVFCNFFHNIANDFYIKTENKTFFLEQCFDFVLRFVRNCIKNIKISMFQEIFSNFEYSSSYLKILIKNI